MTDRGRFCLRGFMWRAMKAKGAIFDLDGTILDSMGVWERVDREFLAKRGYEVPEDYGITIAPMGFHKAAEYTIERFGLKERAEDILREWNELARREYAEVVELKPNAGRYLRYLAERGVRLAVATASHEELFLPALRHLGILDLFEAVVTVYEVKRGKGFPDVYEEAARRIGLAPADCLVFEDIYAGVKGAYDGGFEVIGVYDEMSAEDEGKIRGLAKRYITDFAQLMEE